MSCLSNPKYQWQNHNPDGPHGPQVYKLVHKVVLCRQKAKIPSNVLSHRNTKQLYGSSSVNDAFIFNTAAIVSTMGGLTWKNTEFLCPNIEHLLHCCLSPTVCTSPFKIKEKPNTSDTSCTPSSSFSLACLSNTGA